MKNNKQKRIIFFYHFYRIITIILIISLLATVYAYNKKECTINKKVVKVTNVVNDNTVFLGDSITDFYNVNRYFNEYNIVNSGISGNTTKDILNDLDNRVYRYNPSKVVLLIGINNFLYNDDSVDTVVSDIEDITKKINKKIPNCKIYVESIYPINSDWKDKHNSNVPEIDEIKPKIIETNNRLKKICKDNNYEYLDIFKLLRTDEDLLDSDYTDDGLHPNDQAYIIISDYLKAILFEKSE